MVKCKLDKSLCTWTVLNFFRCDDLKLWLIFGVLFFILFVLLLFNWFFLLKLSVLIELSVSVLFLMFLFWTHEFNLINI